MSKNNSNKLYVLFSLVILFVVGFGLKEEIKKILPDKIDSNNQQFIQAVRDIIYENPQIIIEAIEKAQNLELEKFKHETKQRIRDNAAKIENSDFTPIIGDDKSKVTVTYFFDYRCPYCKSVDTYLNEIIDEYKDKIKVIYKELPLLGKSSKFFSRAALALYSLDKDKYFVFHSRLMSENITDEAQIVSIVQDLDINKNDFEVAMKNPKIDLYLADTNNLALEVGVSAVPFFIINDEILQDSSKESLKNKIDKLLSSNSIVD